MLSKISWMQTTEQYYKSTFRAHAVRKVWFFQRCITNKISIFQLQLWKFMFLGRISWRNFTNRGTELLAYFFYNWRVKYRYKRLKIRLRHKQFPWISSQISHRNFQFSTFKNIKYNIRVKEKWKNVSKFNNFFLCLLVGYARIPKKTIVFY